MLNESKVLKRITKGLYSPLLFLFGIVYLPRFFARLGQAPDRRRLLRERFGYFPNHFLNQKVVWIHAVSVGEVMAAQELIRSLGKLYPDLSLLISTTTPTGQSVAKRLESDHVRVVYFPFDFKGIVRRALDTIRP